MTGQTFLGVDISKLPDEVKQKMTAASNAHKRYQKARDQLRLWNEESLNAAALHTAAQQDWTECLNRWDPDSGKLSPVREDAPLT